MLTDDEVAQMLVAGSIDAYRLASWILRDAACAEDVVQEAALNAWDSRNKMGQAVDPAAWFTKVVVNTCRDELRRRERRRRIPLPASFAEIDPPEELLSVRDEVGRLIGRLTSDEQLVVGLRFGRDLTVPQIAALTGLAEGTVKSRLHNALEHLRVGLAAERRIEERVP